MVQDELPCPRILRALTRESRTRTRPVAPCARDPVKSNFGSLPGLFSGRSAPDLRGYPGSGRGLPLSPPPCYAAALMGDRPTFEFHVSRAARDRYGFDDALFSVTGNVVFANLEASRVFAHRMNTVRGAERHPERTAAPGALNAMGLIDEVLHLVAAVYREQRDPRAMTDALAWFEGRLGRAALDRALLEFADGFPHGAGLPRRPRRPPRG